MRLRLWLLGGLTALLYACAAQPPIPAAKEGASSLVFVARRGWHIDIGLQSADLTPPLDSVAAHFPNAQYIFFGFGDKHYLLAQDHHVPAMLGALWPGAGMMLITAIHSSPDAAFGDGNVIALALKPDQMSALKGYLWNSLRSDHDSVNVYQQGPYEESLYFLATEKYSGFHTCNTWAAEALRASGLPVHSGGVIFADQLWSQLPTLNAKLPARSPAASH
jgi:hypothetical protein